MNSSKKTSLKAVGSSAILAVAASQRSNDLRRSMAAETAGGSTPRRGMRPPAPSPPVEVSATELEKVKMALETSSAALKSSEETLKVRCAPRCLAEDKCVTPRVG